MDIQSLSSGLAQTRVEEEVAVRLHAMAMQSMKDTGAELEKLLETANIITDPSKGNFLDILI